MADDRIGMTTKQKALVFVPLAGLLIYVAGAAFRLLPLPVIPTSQNIYVITTNGYCDGIPEHIIMSASNGDKVYFISDPNGGTYTVDFGSNYPFNEGSNPVTVTSNSVTHSFTAKPVSSVTYYSFTVSNASVCHPLTTNIGIIVTH